MSDEEPFFARLLIEPEPTQEELLAIMYSTRPPAEDLPEETPRSRWTVTGRREQLHRPLYDRRGGWNR